MNWRTIRSGLMVVLIAVNIALFWMNRLEKDRLYSASDADIQQILALYESNGIRVDAVLNRESYPRAPMILGGADILNREIVEHFLGSEYKIVYMDAKQSRYTNDTESILLDPENHRMEYYITDGTHEQIRAKIEEWLGWTCTKSLESEWVYCQERNGRYLYFNCARVRETEEGAEMILQYYEPLGYASQAKEVRPLDELMYGAMKEILQCRSQVVTEIRYGYDLNAYCLEFVLESGETVRMNAYTNEVLE